MPIAERFGRIEEKFALTGVRSDKIVARFELTSASIDMIGVREHHKRNYARIGLRSGAIGERSEAIIASFAAIDATCVMTFVILDAIVAMLDEVEPSRK